MSIIGASVVHKKWGNGTVVSQKDDIISVQFQLSTGETKIVRFQFPEAFSNGFLIPANNESALNINSSIEDQKCDVCGQSHTHTELIDGKHFCSDCKKKNTSPCALCGKPHTKAELESVSDMDKPYCTILVCKDCAEKHSFVCERCEKRYLSKNRAARKLDGKTVCKSCFEKAAKICHFCGATFSLDKGKHFYGYKDYIDVCPQCMPHQTFTCSVCGSKRLNELLVDSRYVPASKKICQECVSRCSKCGEEIDKEQTHSAFGKTFCPSCWEKDRVECPYCGDEFIPETPEQTACPDCVEMEAYVARLEKMDFLNRSYKTINCYSLDYIDRCDLFTRLYEHCRELEGYKFRESSEPPYHFLVMSMLGYNVVVTYLPSEVVGKVKYSRNVTMTEFRSKKGRFAVHSSISEWEESSKHFLETSAGRMKILNYPILLRVQTDYDKVYGKEWNGPYDYIEIGNYGDTTKFYMIGLL